MSTSNEDLLMEMHRVGALMRRAHAGKHHGHGGPGGPGCPDPHGISGHPGPYGAPGGPDFHAGPHGGHPGGPGVPPAGHGMPGDPHGGPHAAHGAHGGHGGPGMPAGHGCPHAHGGSKGAGKHGQARILAALDMKDGVSQKDLAFLLGIRPQSLTVALEALESEGLIERKQDSADKRARLVYITEDGKAKAADQAAERASQAEGVFAALSEDEKDQLAAILAKISVSLEEAAHGGHKTPSEDQGMNSAEDSPDAVGEA